MKKSLNEKDFNRVVQEIQALLYYLENSLNYAGQMVGRFMTFETDDNLNITTDMCLNCEALDELMFQAKKISSKSDMLQNKVNDLVKIVK